jgi:hypothetical protein
MSSSGFVQAFREDLSLLWGDTTALAVYMKLLDWRRTKAETRPNGLLGVRLASGQVATTTRVLARALKIRTLSVVQRALTKLAKLGLITVTTGERGTLITVGSAGRSAGHPPPAREPVPQDIPDASEDEQVAPEVMTGEWEGENEKPLSHPQVARTHVVDPQNKGGGGEEDEEAVDVVRHAQRVLGREIGATEGFRFIAKMRETKTSATRAKAALDWIASHPAARKETKVITRALFLEPLKRVYAPWEEAVLRELCDELNRGLAPSRAAEKMVERMPSLDADTVRAWILAQIGRLEAKRCA